MFRGRFKIVLTVLVSLFLQVCTAQVSADSLWNESEKPSLSRSTKLGIGFTLLGTGALVGLNELWYKDFPRSPLHSFDDSREWQQVDKAGHFLTAYQINRGLHQSFMWAGAEERSARVVSSLLSFGFLGGIELMDGYSEAWGFSWSDLGANSLGIGLYLGQDALWGEQRILPKFSYSPTPLASCRPGTLGSNHLERVFKDYNGQTYWLSLDLNSFTSKNILPPWLSVAVGYGANGMIGAENNDVLTECSGDLSRTRELYLSIDLNGKYIKTNKRWVRGLLKLTEYIKIPAPALRFDSNGTLSAHPLFF